MRNTWLLYLIILSPTTNILRWWLYLRPKGGSTRRGTAVMVMMIIMRMMINTYDTNDDNNRTQLIIIILRISVMITITMLIQTVLIQSIHDILYRETAAPRGTLAQSAPIPDPHSQSVPQSCGSILPTSLTYFALSAKLPHSSRRQISKSWLVKFIYIYIYTHTFPTPRHSCPVQFPFFGPTRDGPGPRTKWSPHSPRPYDVDFS